MPVPHVTDGCARHGQAAHQTRECRTSALTDLPRQQLDFALPLGSASRLTDIPAPCPCREQLEQLIPALLGAGAIGSEAGGQEGPLPGLSQEYFKSLLCDFTASHFMEVGLCIILSFCGLGLLRLVWQAQ